LKNKLQQLLDILFPSRCAGCGLRGIELCDRCISTIRPLGPDSCPICGLPSKLGGLCMACLRREGYLSGIRSACIYEGVARKAIHHFKYRHRRTLADTLARLLDDELQRKPLKVDLLVPVPLHPKRLAERGYNQATLLTERLSERLGIPMLDCLARTKETVSQAKLKAAARRANVRGIFQCVQGTSLNGQRVGVVDDVCTTGATLEDCARALKEAGGGPIWGIVVARDI
jgi:competence protein ComFC